MKPIQILMDEQLVKSMDRGAKRLRLSRSDFISTAVSRYLSDLERAQLESLHRQGYERHPQILEEHEAWEGIQAWPED